MRSIKLIIIIFLLVIFLSAQEKEQIQTEWTIEKVSKKFGTALLEGHGGGEGAIAKWSIANHSLEEVYNALMKELFLMSRTRVEGNLPSGTISAHRPGAFIQFVITQQESGVNILGKWEFVPGEKVSLKSAFSQAKNFFNELFSKVKEALNK